MESNGKVISFVVTMTVIVAVTLAGIREVTKAGAAQNEAVFNKRAILQSVATQIDGGVGDLSDSEVLTLFDKQIEQVTLDMNGEVVESVKAEDVDMAVEEKKAEADRLLPLFVFNSTAGSKFYILSVRGNGLWDKIWGNVALESDALTVAGAAFDHQGETPGLGAEIKDNPAFSQQFEGKKIYNKQGEYKAIVVRKGGARDGIVYEVDGISGATITADGVTEMLQRGIAYYEPYLQGLRKKKEIMN
ncbi:MAG: NADH:ubiquinone reductase (Na(+)-transporting) subunit C [Bacteroidota bacterium]